MSCTGVPDFGLTDCCDEHDRMYAIGGSELQRILTEWMFFKCMRKKGSRFVSFVYFSGVLFFFGPFFWRYYGKPSLFERMFKRG